MTTAERDQIAKATLAWVNQVRKKQGLKRLTRLRKGKRDHTGECPVARSLTDSPGRAIVKTRVAYVLFTKPRLTHRTILIDLPLAAQQFVVIFDATPHYEEFELKHGH